MLLSYSTIENSDVCYDPLFLYTIENGKVTGISYSHWLSGTTRLTEQEDIDYAHEFA